MKEEEEEKYKEEGRKKEKNELGGWRENEKERELLRKEKNYSFSSFPSFPA